MKIIFRSSFWLAVAGAFMLTALVVLKDVVLFPFVEWYLAGALREEFATNLTTEGIEGNLVSDLRIRTLILEPRDTGKVLEFLAAEEIVLRYHLPDLLGGWKNFLHNIHCDIHRAQVKVAFAGDEVESPPDAATEPVAIPLLPAITLHDSALQVRMEDGNSIQATGINLDFGMSSVEHPFSSVLSAENISYISDDKPLFSSSLEGAFRIGETGVEIDRLLLAEQEIIRQGNVLFVQERAGDLSFAGEILPFAGTLQLSASLSDQIVNVSLRAQDFDLKKASAWLPQINGIVSGKLQAEADLAVHLAEHPFIQGTFSLAARDGSLQGYAFQELMLKGGLDAKGISLEKATATTPSLDALLHDFSLAYDFGAPAQWPELLTGLRGDFTLRTSDIPGLLHTMGVEGDTILASNAPPHNLSLSGDIDGRRVHFSEGKLTSENIRLNVANSSMGLPSQGTFSEIPVTLHLDLQVDRLEDAAAIFSLPDITGRAEAEIDLSGTFATLAGKGHVSASNLAYTGKLLGDLQADLVADSKTLRIRNFSLKNSGDVLLGEGALRLADQHIEHIQLKAEFQEKSPLLATFLPENIVQKDLLRLNISGQGLLADPDFSLHLQTEELSSGSLPLNDVAFSLKKEKAHFDIDFLRLQSPYGNLNIAASADKNAAKASWGYKITTLDFGSGKNLFRLLEQASGQVSWPRIDIKSLQLQSGTASISLSGVLDIQGNSSATFAFSGLSSEHLPPALLQDRFHFQGGDVNIVFAGPLQNPTLQGKGSVAEISAPQLPFPLQGNFDITYQDSWITLDHFLWASSDGLRLDARGKVPFQPGEDMLAAGPLTLRAGITVPEISALEPFIQYLGTAGGTVNLDVDLSGSWQEPLGHVRIDGHNISLPETTNYGISKFSSVSAELLASHDSLLLQDAKALAEGVELTLQGKWANPPELASLESGGWREEGGDMHIEAALSIKDIGILTLPLEGVRRISGSLRAQASLDGRADSLKLGGTVFLKNGEMRAEFLPSSAREISITADFDQHGIVLSEMQAELGGSPLRASGTITFAESGPETDLLVTGDNLLLARDDGMLIRSDARISLVGPLSSWNISGEMAVTEGRITRQIDFLGMLKGDKKPRARGESGLFSFPSPPLRDARLNVLISARKPLLIKNNLFNGTIRPQLALKGTGELPFLEGKVYIDSSKLKLPSGKLTIDSGIVTYPKENPDQPILDIKAGSKMLGYDIAMQVHGNLAEPLVTLSSVPPLPSDQLLLLLLTGQPPAQGVSADGRQKGNMKLALYFGRDFLSRWLYSDDVDDETILDRFDLEIGRDITKSGDDTIDASFELGRDIFKRSGIYFITAEKDVYDDFNMGLKIVFRLAD